MPEFRTEVDIDPYEYVDECSRHELQELIDELVDRGFVLQISSPNKTQPNLLEIEWFNTITKLSKLRQRLSIEEEETIKALVEKYS